MLRDFFYKYDHILSVIILLFAITLIIAALVENSFLDDCVDRVEVVGVNNCSLASCELTLSDFRVIKTLVSTHQIGDRICVKKKVKLHDGGNLR